MTTSIDLAALAALVKGPMAKAVESGQARIAEMAVPGLPEGTAWSVSVPSNPHMPHLVVGRGPGARLRQLTGRPEAFRALVADLPVSIPDAATALAYVKAYLLATRDYNVLLQVIEDPAKIAWRPGSPQEEAAKRVFLAGTRFDPILGVGKEGFEVSLVILRDQHAQRSTFRVDRNGRIDIEDEVLQEGLPLPVLR